MKIGIAWLFIGVFVGGSLAAQGYWVQGDANNQSYTEPNCPPAHVPRLIGVATSANHEQLTLYECVIGTQSRMVTWNQLEQEQTNLTQANQ